MSKKLREGFTTGTAVAGAAKAGLVALFGNILKEVEVQLPPFIESKPSLQLTIPLHCIELEKASNSSPQEQNQATVHVIKDGGDDPDATSGMEIVLTVACSPIIQIEQAVSKHEGLLKNRCVPIDYTSLTSPLKVGSKQYGFFAIKVKDISIYVTTGAGVGIVTLPGLPVSIGEPAYNPEPRKQLCMAILDALPSSTKEVYLHLEVPSGEERACKTLNPRLGILGGISILGTHGVVRPYSHKAFTASISQGIDVAVALGLKTVLLSTGRRSEKLLFALYKNISTQSGVQVADFAAHSIKYCVSKKIEHIIWGCFPGKLVKLSQGLEWTHASQGAPDMELLRNIWNEVGGDTCIEEEILAMPTAVGAFSLMSASDTNRYLCVIERLGEKALHVIRSWVGDTHATRLTLHVFSMEGDLLLHMSDGKQ